jgi:hypothetical protein
VKDLLRRDFITAEDAIDMSWDLFTSPFHEATSTDGPLTCPRGSKALPSLHTRQQSGGSPMEASEQQHAEMKRQESDASVTSSSSSNSSCDSGCALPFIEDQDMGEPLEVEQPARSSEKPPLAAKPYTAKQTVGANSTSFKSPKLTSISAK